MVQKKPVTLTAAILTVAVVVVLYLNSHGDHDFHGVEHAEAGSYPEAKSFISEYDQDNDPVELKKSARKTNQFVWTDEEIFWPGEQIMVNHDFSSHQTQSKRIWVALMRADEKTPVRSFDAKEPIGQGSFSVDNKGNYVIRAFSGDQGQQIGDDVHITVDVIAEVSHGKLQGKTIVSNDKTKTVFAFPSVQYGIVDARNKFGLARKRTYKPGVEKTNFDTPGCYQEPKKRPDVPTKMSINCLYLSVYTFSRRTSLPVVVYIHGGNYESGNQKFYNGARLAASQKIVVVSINYRLGVYGSLYLTGTSAVGNQMLSDQVLALQWVKRNIRYFGGNPNKVTIMGQSAGGTSVIALMISSLPKKTLFKHVIAFSPPLSLPSQTAKSWKKWISKLNQISRCNVRGVNSARGNRRLLSCLNRMSPRAIIRAQNKTKEYYQKKAEKSTIKDMTKLNFAPGLTAGQPWTITVGVRHPVISFKKELMDILKECGNRGRNSYELMIGYCKDDAYEYTPTTVKKAVLGKVFQGLSLFNGKAKLFTRKRYRCKWKGGQHCIEKFENIMTDGIFRCPSLAAALSTSPGKAYLYHMMEHPSFGKHLPFKREQCWKKNIICHSCLLPYVWNMNGFLGIKADPKEEKLIGIVQRAIGHFAYHGKPPQTGKYKWPAVSNERDNVAVFNRPFHIDRGQPETRDCNPWFAENVKGFAMRRPGVCRVGKASNFLGFGGRCSKACRKKGYANPVETGHSKGSGYWLCGAKGRAGVNIDKNKKTARRPSSSRSSSRRSSSRRSPPQRSSSRRSSPRRSSPRRSSPRRSPPRQRSSPRRPSRRRACYANGALKLAQDEDGEDIPMEDEPAPEEELESMQVAEPDAETAKLMAVPDRWTSRWVRIPGHLTNVAVSSIGSIYGVNRYGRIYAKRSYNRGGWRRLPGALTQISVNTAGTLVTGVNRRQYIYYARVTVRNLGAVRWTNVRGRLVDVTSGRAFMYGVTSHDHIYRANLMKRNWCRLPGALRQISAHGTKVVGVNKGGAVYQYLGYGRWRYIRAPRARCASMGRDGDLWVIGTNQLIYRLVGGRFRRIPGALVQIDVADKNNIVGVNRAQQIYAFVSKRLPPPPRPRSPSRSRSKSRSGSASQERTSGESASRDEMVNEDELVGEDEVVEKDFWKKLKKKAKKGWNKLKKKAKKHVKKFKKTVKKHVKKVKKHVKKIVKKVKKHVKKVVNKIKNFFGKYTCKVPGKGTKLRFDCFCETVKNQVKQIRSRGTSCGVVCRRANLYAVLVSKSRNGWNYGCCAAPGPGCKGGTNFAGRGRTICRTSKGNVRSFMCLCY